MELLDGHPRISWPLAMRGMRWLIERLLGVRLGRFHHYRPRELHMPAGPVNCSTGLAPLPISIVTPSFNQGTYLEQTIQSVLNQNYPSLEYIIQDGGSTDDTLGILARYAKQFAHSESAPDKGQAHAINLGFRHAAGEVLAYLNSDDLLLPGTLQYVSDYFQGHPEIDVVYGHRIVIDEAGAEIGRWIMPPHNDNVLSWTDYVPQETLFWRRRIWEKVGSALNESLQFALDWDLLLRFRDAGARFVRLPRFLGAFRVHREQKTMAQMANIGVPEMNRLYQRSIGRPLNSLERYRHIFPYLFQHAVLNKLYRLGLVRYR